MFLLDLRNRVQRHLSNRAAGATTNQPPPAFTPQELRAANVLRLQSDVHRLQLEIADLSQSQHVDAVPGEKGKSAAKVGMLQDELTQAQQALAKLQGRV